MNSTTGGLYKQEMSQVKQALELKGPVQDVLETVLRDQKGDLWHDNSKFLSLSLTRHPLINIVHRMVNNRGERVNAVFVALADPTRRGMIARLSAGPATIGELGRPFPITKPAVTKHVKVLERAGLIRRKRSGRTHYCTLQSKPMEQARDWIEWHSRFWKASLDALTDYVEKTNGKGQPR